MRGEVNIEKTSFHSAQAFFATKLEELGEVNTFI